MISTYTSPFEQAAEYLPVRIREQLYRLSELERKQTHELRLRLQRPFAVSMCNRQLIPIQSMIITPRDIEDSFKQVCEYSIHTYSRELAQGFITVRGGHRVGICGTAVVKSGEIESIKDISGLNIRIARQVLGCANEITDTLTCHGIASILLIGAPSSGKTTILRDLCRQIGKKHKLSIIDERGEIAASYRGTPQNDVGENSDVLDGYPKSAGVITALRALSPQVIVCDEIGGEDDCQSLRSGVHSGVKLLATAHADSVEDIYRRKHIAALLFEGAFDYIVLLSGGKVKQISRVVDENDKVHRCGSTGIDRLYDRVVHVGKA